MRRPDPAVGTPESSSLTCTPGSGWVAARPGTTAIPSPAATNACTAMESSEARATAGSKPASRHALRTIRNEVSSGDPHPPLPGELPQGEARDVRRRMPSGQQDPEMVVEQMHRAPLGTESQRGRRVVVHEREVDARVDQLHEQPLHVVVDDRDGHTWVRLPQPGHGARDEGGESGGKLPSRRRPALRPASSSSSCSASSNRARTASPCRTTVRPSGVSSSGCDPRRTSFEPRRRSRAASAGSPLTASRRAPRRRRANEPASSAAQRARTPRSCVSSSTNT